MAAALLGLAVGVASAEPITLRLKNGQSMTGDLVAVGPNAVSYRLTGGAATLSQTYNELQTIEFPEPELWLEGESALEEGALTEALSAFSKLVGSQPDVTFYPAPGNYRTRAQRKLVDCYRRQRNASAIARTLTEIEWAKLPPDEQGDIPLLKLWSALGAKDAKTASEEAADLEAQMGVDDPSYPEFAFVRGKLASQAGANAEAIRFFGACYGLPNGDAGLAKDALEESIRLLSDMPSREAELRALTHLYTVLCDSKGLWAEAPEAARAALSDDLPEVEAMDRDATLAFEMVQSFRYEPNPNPPPKPKGDKKRVRGPSFEPIRARFSLIDAPSDWTEAETRVGKFEPTRSGASLSRLLKEDVRYKLGPGTAIRLSFDLRLDGTFARTTSTPESIPFIRIGLLDAQRSGFFANLPVGQPATCRLGLDLGGDEDPFVGKDQVLMLPQEQANEHPGMQANQTSHGELVIRFKGDGRIGMTFSLDGVEVSASHEAEPENGPEGGSDEAASAPEITDFSLGYLALRIGQFEGDLLIDNLHIETGR